MIATLLMLAVAALVLPTLAHELHLPAGEHEQALSVVCALALLVVFAVLTRAILTQGERAVPAEAHARADAWPLATGHCRPRRLRRRRGAGLRLVRRGAGARDRGARHQPGLRRPRRRRHRRQRGRERRRHPARLARQGRARGQRRAEQRAAGRGGPGADPGPRELLRSAARPSPWRSRRSSRWRCSSPSSSSPSSPSTARPTWSTAPRWSASTSSSRRSSGGDEHSRVRPLSLQFADIASMSVLPLRADIRQCRWDVRLVPKADMAIGLKPSRPAGSGAQ